ncbi:uncharacterized protein RHOBADRAFT_55431 [Rhodotorula graminis WP1]|uniref:Uncharacterized protein n=1 Tax=Rhodotorula graminis (strain WP1) TaxID=578459 RepID=A0A0P9ITK1_RHOGW|nr:uncharacterized protein RHOBADRAFT_55431 [Rhodotorula graminis WP1]KPV72735.1 hypothetical protein RHOBADRAFT_55431 [Rhodotorula graminis WP1]
MDAHLRRHSIGSSTGSLSDDLLYSNAHSAPLASSTAFTYQAGPPDTSYAFSDHESPLNDPHSRASSSRRSSFAHSSPLAAVPPSVVPLGTLTTPGTPKAANTATAAPGVGTGRSRARAFSFLGAHDAYGDRHDAAGATPHTGATPFVGSAYDSAFELGDDEGDADSREGDGDGGDSDDDGLEMREVGGAGAAAAAKARTSGYRTRFQPLVSYELAWMAVSAASVLGLTVAAVVLAFVG